MSYSPKNPNGQASMANSAPVVIASDQSNVPISGTVTVQQSTASSLKVDLSGTGANTTALKVDASATTQPVSGTVTANAGTGTFAVNASQIAGTTTSVGNGVSGTGVQRVTLASDSTGQIALASGATVGLATGTNSVGTVGLNAGTNVIGDVNLNPAQRGGWSVSSQSNLTTTATVSGTTGKFGGYMFLNLNTSPAYLQVFDTTGAITLGTTIPTFIVPIPSNATSANGAGANLEMTNGIAITNGIKVAATTTATGATTVTTGLIGFVLYK